MVYHGRVAGFLRAYLQDGGEGWFNLCEPVEEDTLNFLDLLSNDAFSSEMCLPHRLTFLSLAYNIALDCGI